MRLLLIISLLVSACAQAAIDQDGPLLPSKRIVAYYGNFYSKRMGVLGEYPPEKMLEMLKEEVAKWNEADPDTPVVPAIEYIAVVAQEHPGQDGKYRARMPEAHIHKALALADSVDGIVILDIQVGLSNVRDEIARFDKYLKMPNVMLAFDPEFDMPTSTKPGHVIGSMDAKDINYAIEYMSEIVRKYDLPPKVLVIHRFTQRMVKNYQDIRPTPEVQVVINMDGWGPQTLKRSSYNDYIAAEPVDYAGIKLFYKHDRRDPKSGLFTPEQLLGLKPVPVFIMYQ